ncbi:MAG: hypothetical protein ACTHJ2_02835 [Candidatus Nitrosocosmicus sp.]
MSNENINNNNNKKNIVYLLFETNSAKKDYNDEIIGVFSTNDKAEDYKQKLEKHLNNAPNNGPLLIEYYVKPFTVDAIDPMHTSTL